MAELIITYATLALAALSPKSLAEPFFGDSPARSSAPWVTFPLFMGKTEWHFPLIDSPEIDFQVVSDKR